MARIKTPAQDIQPGDELLTDAGFIPVGGTVDLGGGRTGITTPDGMISVGDEDVVTVRRGGIF